MTTGLFFFLCSFDQSCLCSFRTVTRLVVLKAGCRFYNGLQSENCWSQNPFCAFMMWCARWILWVLRNNTKDSRNVWKNILDSYEYHCYLLYFLLSQQKFSSTNRAAKKVCIIISKLMNIAIMSCQFAHLYIVQKIHVKVRNKKLFKY